MLRNYLKTALRNLWKHKGISLVNILGLGLAFGISLLLILTAFFEFSFDSFHQNEDRIFRVYKEVQRLDKLEKGTAMPAPLKPALDAELPDIEYSVRHVDHSSIIEWEKDQFDLMVRAVDQEFFQLFTFPLLRGSKEEVLSGLNHIVLTEKTAKRIFGETDPMGKTLGVFDGSNYQEFMVNGICEDNPKNSSLTFDVLIRFEAQAGYKEHLETWNDQYHDVYVQLKEGVSQKDFEEKLKPFVAHHLEGDIKQLENEGVTVPSGEQPIKLKLQPLEDVHENTLLATDAKRAQFSYPNLLLLLAAFLVLVAAFNFVNLTIARYLSRAKEAGVRKVLGAHRKLLIAQFWGEALLLGIVSIVIGAIIFYDLIPSYNSLFRRNIHLGQFQDPWLWGGIAGGLFGLTFLAGAYPAWWLSRINMPDIFKGKVQLNTPGGIRNTLIVIQFAIASLLIACTLIAWTQIDYLRNKPLGFNKDQVISLPIGQSVESAKVIPLMRDKLASNPRILSLSACDDNLGVGLDDSQMTSVFGFIKDGKTYRTHGMEVDYDFVKTLDIELIQGRAFSRSFSTDSASAILINQAMAEELAVEDPIGLRLPLMGQGEGQEVIGVFQDFHFESLHKPIEPLTLFLQRPWPLEYLFIKVKPEGLKNSLEEIEKAWAEIAPQAAFQASFLDENTDRLYREEQRLSHIFLSATLLAIFISCLGLFAMALLAIKHRTREIGIRKVLGATVTHIVGLLSKQFIGMVLISLLIAIPFAWYGMSRWLEDFAFRVELPWWVFGLTALLALGIAFLTVSFHSVRAALLDPVKALKSID